MSSSKQQNPSQGRPHLLAVTVLGCALVVWTLAVAALTDSAVVAGLAFLVTILVTGWLTETMVLAVAEPADAPPAGDAGEGA
jgi:4-amino-4-deoxy-L-arabinose transferase-like glycosyltransferase